MLRRTLDGDGASTFLESSRVRYGSYASSHFLRLSILGQTLINWKIVLIGLNSFSVARSWIESSVCLALSRHSR